MDTPILKHTASPHPGVCSGVHAASPKHWLHGLEDAVPEQWPFSEAAPFGRWGWAEYTRRFSRFTFQCAVGKILQSWEYHMRSVSTENTV